MQHLLAGEKSLPLYPTVHTKLILNKLAQCTEFKGKHQGNQSHVTPEFTLTVEIACDKDHRTILIAKLLFKAFAFTV